MRIEKGSKALKPELGTEKKAKRKSKGAVITPQAAVAAAEIRSAKARQLKGR